MDTITLPDGERELIFDRECFGFLIGERLGLDAERYFSRLVDDLDAEADRTRQELNSDLRGYEMDLYNRDTTIREVSDILDELEDHLDGKRMNRAKIADIASRIRHEIDEYT